MSLAKTNPSHSTCTQKDLNEASSASEGTHKLNFKIEGISPEAQMDFKIC